MLSLVYITNSYAGQEDWNGMYLIMRTDGEQHIVRHTPTHVQFLFFTIGECLELHKGSSINGVKMSEDAKICRDSNTDDFTKEVAKLGTIIDQVIDVGPTYYDEQK